MDLVSAFSYSRVSRQASAIDNATPLGLQAPGLMITRASQKRLPWGRLVSDMNEVLRFGAGLLLTAASDALPYVELRKLPGKALGSYGLFRPSCYFSRCAIVIGGRGLAHIGCRRKFGRSKRS